MVSKYFYLEFVHLIKDYFETSEKKELFYEWMAPLVLGVVFYFIPTFGFQSLSSEIISNFINVLAILVGFSITSISILTTSSSENVNNLKGILSRRKLGNRLISLYQLIVITFSFVLVVEIFLLVYNLFLQFFINTTYSKILFSIDIFFITNILLLNLRNITNIYFIFFRRKDGL